MAIAIVHDDDDGLRTSFNPPGIRRVCSRTGGGDAADTDPLADAGDATDRGDAPADPLRAGDDMVGDVAAAAAAASRSCWLISDRRVSSEYNPPEDDRFGRRRGWAGDGDGLNGGRPNVAEDGGLDVVRTAGRRWCPAAPRVNADSETCVNPSAAENVGGGALFASAAAAGNGGEHGNVWCEPVRTELDAALDCGEHNSADGPEDEASEEEEEGEGEGEGEREEREDDDADEDGEDGGDDDDDDASEDEDDAADADDRDEVHCDDDVEPGENNDDT